MESNKHQKVEEKSNLELLIKRTLNEFKYMDEDKVFLTIAIDFDGTVVEHNYPYLGKDLPHCVDILKMWQEKYNVGYILSTMRSGKELDDAVNWFKERNIPLYGIQQHPTQHTWTSSPKPHARYCLDDRNIGCPLTLDSRGVPCVDWLKVNETFEPCLKEVYNKMRK